MFKLISPSGARARQAAFMMPAVVILLTASTLILTALFQYVVTIAGFSNESIYRQVAYEASISGLEQAKDRFDGNTTFDVAPDTVTLGNTQTCGTGTATPNAIADALEECVLFQNSTYKVTMDVDITSTSVDGRSKRVTSIGRVYLPANAATARYERRLNSEVVRSAIVANNPSDFSPLAWYDATCNPSTSADPACQAGTVFRTGTDDTVSHPGGANWLREERDTGADCGGEPNNGDGKLGFGESKQAKESCPEHTKQDAGIIFSLSSVSTNTNYLPSAATITDAYIQLMSHGSSKDAVTYSVKGICQANTATFTNGTANQLSTRPRTTASVTWSPPDWTGGNQSGSAQRITGLGPIVQEMISSCGWVSGNRMGFVIHQTNSSDAARLARTSNSDITLNVTYSNGTIIAANNDDVDTWRDRSGNGFHLTTVTGTSKPTKSTISSVNGAGTSYPNTAPMLSFAYGDGMRVQVPAATGRKSNAYTAFMFGKIYNDTGWDTSTSTMRGRGTLVEFYGAGTWGGSSAASTGTFSGPTNGRIVPFWRHPLQGYHSFDAIGGKTERSICNARFDVEVICQSAIASMAGTSGTGHTAWALFSSRVSLIEKDALFRLGGRMSPPPSNTDPVTTINAPYYISIAYEAQNNVFNSHMDVSEIILYDRALTCPQIEAVEQYLAEKYGLTNTALNDFNTEYLTEGCRENNIPAF